MNWTIRQSEENKELFDKLKMVYVGGAVLAMAYTIVFRAIVFPLLGLVVLFASTSEFFLGKKFTLDETSAKAGLTEITWPSVKSVHVSEKLIYLSPFESESKLDTFRGVKLTIQNVSKESVLEYVRNHVGEHVRFLEG
jgi:hypothetical protein